MLSSNSCLSINASEFSFTVRLMRRNSFQHFLIWDYRFRFCILTMLSSNSFLSINASEFSFTVRVMRRNSVQHFLIWDYRFRFCFLFRCVVNFSDCGDGQYLKGIWRSNTWSTVFPRRRSSFQVIELWLLLRTSICAIDRRVFLFMLLLSCSCSPWRAEKSPVTAEQVFDFSLIHFLLCSLFYWFFVVLMCPRCKAGLRIGKRNREVVVLVVAKKLALHLHLLLHLHLHLHCLLRLRPRRRNFCFIIRIVLF